ncbi:hypothetical protein QQX98_006858 [Neonectria punicea]|uniref:NACHT domain-containing protein n=1 Tax=Neonectria punicea TaxID=979145 RepID=A0ABR1GZQ5_9HYPO
MSAVSLGHVILLAGGTIAFYLWLRNRLTHPQSTSQRVQEIPAREGPTLPAGQKRGVRLCPVPIPSGNETEAGVDIIAIHGLDTKSPDTWTWRDPKYPRNPGVNWLSHPDMLPHIAKSARIFTCDWPADLFQQSDSIQKTNEEFARRLLDGIKRRPPATNDRGTEDRPIIFIASCLGGVILMKALVMADNEYRCIRTATRGIVFLATPFRGTSFQDVARWAEPGLKAWATIQGQEVSKLLENVKESFDLDELVGSFTHFCQEQLCQDLADPQVMTFYELGKTNLYHKVFSCLRVGAKQLVDRSSATLQIIRHPLSLNRPHVLMNKFGGPEDPDYQSVAGKIEKFLLKIRKNEADDWIRDNHYTPERLKIDRLSDEPLPMDQCYVNLAIVEQVAGGQDAARSNSPPSSSSPFTLFARQKVEIPDKTVQVELATIFDEREGRDDRTIQPRRILIRGRAGVGKTTLCKKIVYEFCRGTWSEWSKLFDRVLWVPLRNLKNEPKEGYNLEGLLVQEYLSQNPNGKKLAHRLWVALDATQYGKTLFVLDGLDEILGGLDETSNMSHLLKFLLKLPNVIITSRPQMSPPHWLKGSFDLELETIGFYPDQVDVYVKKAFTSPEGKVDWEKAGKIQSFLEEHPLIQGLVRIPIQLDALCCTWDDLSSGTVPDTMTGIYQAIERTLWKKDAVRLDKKHNKERVTYDQLEGTDCEGFVEYEIYFLENLAFAGLYNDVIEFTSQHREVIRERYMPRNFLPAKTLPHLSFLRTSDPSSDDRNRYYHFLHLTFQEYFAARYFVRQWNVGRPLESIRLDLSRKSDGTQPLPAEFLQKAKYSARYDVFWRFVAGLLAAGDERNTLNFFEAIEKEPRDLLGPTHQRLVMHCLSEVSTDMTLRQPLERKLTEWLLFECTFQRTAHLARDMEFPEQALHDALQDGPDDAKIIILQALKRRPTIPLSVNELALSWLTHDTSSQLKRQVCILLQSSRKDLTSDALEVVVQQLDDKDSGILQAALRVLQKQSSLSDEFLPDVVQQLDNTERDIIAVALKILKKPSSLPDETLAIIVKQLEHESLNVQEVALEVLRMYPDLLNKIHMDTGQRLNDENPDNREAALRMWSRLRSSDESLPVVVQRLDDEASGVRKAALGVLKNQSSLSDEILLAIVQRLDDEDSDVRDAALEVLQNKSSLSDEILLSVVQRLNDKDSDVRWAALRVLQNKSSLSDEILPAMVQRLNDEDSDVRDAALEVLQNKSSLSDEILLAVVQRLDNEDSDVRWAVLRVLQNKSSLSDEILLAIVQWLDDEDLDVRWAALRVLRNKSSLSNEILLAIVQRLDDEDLDIQDAALEVLQNKSSLSDEILLAVVQRLDDEDLFIREAALRTLQNKSSLSDEILLAIVQRLEFEDEGYLAEAVLRKHEDFYSTLLSGPYVGSLFKILLRRAFEEQYSWHVEDGRSCVHMPDGVIRATLENEKEFRDMANEARPPGTPLLA